MQAQVLYGIGDIRREVVDRPKLRENMVLVKVMAAGICGSDIPRIYQTGAHKMPLIPGHEFSGLVEETGAGADVKWKGKRVGIFPLIPCMKCPQCLKRRYEMCQSYDYLGSRTDGGFAEYAVVPEWNLLELPEEVTFEQAAMLEPSSVAMHAVRGILEGDEKVVGSTDAVGKVDGISNEAMQAGGSLEEEGRLTGAVAVCGLGTIGLLITMILKSMGMQKVFVLGNKSAQEKMAERIGIPRENICNTAKEDALHWIVEKTDGQGVEIFFECVGKNETVNLALSAAASGGRVMMVGNPASDMLMDRDIYWKILRKQLLIKGTWNSSYQGEEGDDWHRVLRALKEGWLHPEDLITHRLSLEKLGEGLTIMRDKTEDYVKIMMRPEG